MAQFSPTGTMANAGTSSRIAPRRKGGFFQRIGAGIESLVDTAAPMISPEVREFENLRINRQQMDQRQQQIDQQQQQIGQKQQQIEAENRPIFLEGNDSALRNLLPPEQEFILKKARQIGIVQEDENGRPFVAFKDGQKALQELQDTPEEQAEINNVGIKYYNSVISNLNEQKGREVNKIVKSMMKNDLSASEMAIREKVEKGQLIETAEMRRIKADMEFTNKKLQEKKEDNRLLLGQGKDDTTFTKTAEEMSLATFGRPFGELSQLEQNKVIERKYKAEPERIKASMALRKEFNDLPEIKAFKEVRQRFSLMDDAFLRSQSEDLESNVALDQLLITSFNKLTDPESVVRESEYLRTPENISFVNRLRGKYGKILEGGGGLTEVERKELVNSANLMRNSYFKFTKDAAMQYAEIASRSGLDPELVITIPDILKTPSPTVDKTSFNELPNPAGFKGKTMTDTDTGEKFRSDGLSWRLIK